MTRTPSSLDTLAVRAVQHGRRLHAQIAGLKDCPIGDLQSDALHALLRRLEHGEVADDRDLFALEALAKALAADLPVEITGTREEGRLVGCDEEGGVWDVEEVPAYSRRGEALVAVQNSLAAFLALRRELLDRVRAERLLLALLR